MKMTKPDKTKKGGRNPGTCCSSSFHNSLNLPVYNQLKFWGRKNRYLSYCIKKPLTVVTTCPDGVLTEVDILGGHCHRGLVGGLRTRFLIHHAQWILSLFYSSFMFIALFWTDSYFDSIVVDLCFSRQFWLVSYVSCMYLVCHMYLGILEKHSDWKQAVHWYLPKINFSSTIHWERHKLHHMLLALVLCHF